MITTPEIICDVFSFLDKDQIERIQLVNQFWNNVIIRRKNILPLREFEDLQFCRHRFHLYTTVEVRPLHLHLESYIINFDGTNLSKGDVSSQYSQLTVDEVLTNLNDVVFDTIRYDSEYGLDNLLNLMKIVTTKTGSRFRGRYGKCYAGIFDSKLDEIFDNYIIVDELYLGSDSYNRELCANPEIVELPSTPNEIRLTGLEFDKNEEVLHFTCNGKLNGSNRLTIELQDSDINYGNFIRQWFELYRTHENPISLVGKFEIISFGNLLNIVLDAIKTFLNNTQLRVKYSLETKEFRQPHCRFTYQYYIRRCVLHETDSYALVIEMVYEDRYQEIDMSSINASDLDQPPRNKMKTILFCVKSL